MIVRAKIIFCDLKDCKHWISDSEGYGSNCELINVNIDNIDGSCLNYAT